jgi:DnaJ-class molecular chaperone
MPNSGKTKYGRQRFKDRCPYCLGTGLDKPYKKVKTFRSLLNGHHFARRFNLRYSWYLVQRANCPHCRGRGHTRPRF